MRTESQETTDEYVSVLGMSPCYQSRLVLKVLPELYVEDHMTPHELVVLRDVFRLPFKQLEGGANISHLLANGIPPKCVPILLIYLLRLLN